MSELLEQLANYRAHVDRAIDFPNSDGLDPDLIEVFTTDTDEGEVMVLDMPKQDAPPEPRLNGRIARSLAMVAAAVAIVVVGAVLVRDGDDTVVTEPATSADTAAEPDAVAAEASPAAATILAYIDAYNAKDIDAVMTFFTEESTLMSHPVVTAGEAAEGTSRIRDVLLRDFGDAAESDAYAVSNVVAVGNDVSWDHIWTSRFGLQWCATGHEATVEDGIIVRWVFGDISPCAEE